MKLLSDEIIDEILKRVRDGEIISHLAREYEIGESTIRGWITGKRRTGKDFNPEHMSLAEHRRIKELEKENKALYELVGELTVELKKRKSDLN